MVSSLYIVLGALLLIKLSLDVVKLRTQYQVAYGDGGFYELQTAIRVHGNAVEYIPISMLLLIMMEMNGAPVWMLHICGLVLLAGRVLHYFGLHHRDIRWRRMGMAATYISMVIMIINNIYYLPWEQIFSLYT
ncbi:MAPEG family protein [Xenorhabdus sp. DI]|uniref:MAPEG family protein n=1 Tax=Xenorhabdus doucetiae TaxID=351671 RepID=UPI0019A0D47E|nr:MULTISPECIES: MAPEG family protein [unclassified Xenorhabdus]MBD2785611.1 MAPEG family protein [Xenorhabdus sp. 3]MBD2786996.1 MAPEG family protein [Xenorhabdus sp. DI]